MECCVDSGSSIAPSNSTALRRIRGQATSSHTFRSPNIYALTNRHDEAISEWQKIGTMVGYQATSEAIARAYRRDGYEKALRVIITDLEAASQTSYVQFSFIASMCGYMGDRDRAFAWLKKAYAVRDGVDSLRGPMWDPLRSDPRFKDLVRRVGLPT